MVLYVYCPEQNDRMRSQTDLYSNISVSFNKRKIVHLRFFPSVAQPEAYQKGELCQVDNKQDQEVGQGIDLARFEYKILL